MRKSHRYTGHWIGFHGKILTGNHGFYHQIQGLLSYNVRPARYVCWFRFAPVTIVVTIVINTINHKLLEFFEPTQLSNGGLTLQVYWEPHSFPPVNVYIAMENGLFIDDLPIKMVIYHGYVKLPEGIQNMNQYQITKQQSYGMGIHSFWILWYHGT